MDNNINEKDELQEMRRPMECLKETLAGQNIVTDEALRRAMVNRSSWLGKLVRGELWAAPLLILVLSWQVMAYGMSWWPLILFIVLLLPSIWLDSKTVVIPEEKILHCSLTELRRFMLWQTKWRNIQFAIEFVLSLAWLGWYIYEMMLSMATPENPFDIKDFCWLFAFSGLGGIIAVVVIYRKISKTHRNVMESLGDADDE